MSEETKLVSLSQLDEMLDASVKMAEMQAADYIQRGMQSMGTHVLRTAIEQRDRQRAQFIERARQQPAAAQQPKAQQPAAAQQPEAQQPATPPAPPATAQTPAPSGDERVRAHLEASLAHFPMHMRPMIDQTTRDALIRRAREAAGVATDPRFDVSLPFGVAPISPKH